MTLDEYLKDTDPNMFWKLSCGEHENLLDEAIERIEELEKQNKKLKLIRKIMPVNSITGN